MANQLKAGDRAIFTDENGNKIPVRILSFDGNQYKLAADFTGNTNWFDKQHVTPIK